MARVIGAKARQHTITMPLEGKPTPRLRRGHPSQWEVKRFTGIPPLPPVLGGSDALLHPLIKRFRTAPSGPTPEARTHRRRPRHASQTSHRTDRNPRGPGGSISCRQRVGSTPVSVAARPITTVEASCSAWCHDSARIQGSIEKRSTRCCTSFASMMLPASPSQR
jgi:hypothetical protein